MTDSHVRSLAKAISWRVTGTLDTFLISWLITGQALLAGGIAATEVATKIILFYGHERVWTRIRWGRGDQRELRARSLAKAISWRATGTLDTFLISWLITGQALLAGGIAGTEVITKLVLFYLLERAWARLHWGRGTEGAAPAGTSGLPA